jgi:hypothetical protein
LPSLRPSLSGYFYTPCIPSGYDDMFNQICIARVACVRTLATMIWKMKN